MEEQPSFEPQETGAETSRQSKTAGFIKRLGIVLIASLVTSALYALVIGPRSLSGFSDGLFVVGALVLIIGLLPLIGDIFGRSTVSFRLKDQTLKDVLQDQRERTKKNDTTTYLFGIGGTIVIALSFLIGFAVR